MSEEITPMIYKILLYSILLSTMVSIITGIWCVYEEDVLIKLLYKGTARVFFCITIISAAAVGLIKVII